MPPPPKGGYVGGVVDGPAFADEAFHLAAVLGFQRADAQRCRDQRHEAAEFADRQLPQFDFDGGAVGALDQPGLGRCGVGQGIEPVAGRGAGAFQQHGAAVGELVIERHAGEVGAHHRHGDHAVVAAGGGRLRRGQGVVGGAGLPGAVALPAAAELGQGAVLPGGADQGDAHRQAVVAEAAGQGQGAHIQQVDEVGPGAELAVELDRFLGHRRAGMDARRGGHHQGVHPGHQLIRLAAQIGQAVLGAEAVGGAHILGGQNHIADHRQQRVFFQQRLGHGIAFGDPGALVEQLGGFAQHAGIQRNQLGNFRQLFQVALPGGGGALVAEPGRVLGNAQARPLRQGGGQRLRRRARVAVQLVVDTEQVVDPLRVFHAQREHADAVQGAAGGHHATGAHAALGGLEAHGVGERRRHPAGAGGVGAQRERHQAQGDHRRRAGAGTAGDIVRVKGVGHFAVGRAHAHQAGGQLIQVGLADQDGAGVEQRLHRRRGFLGGVGVGGAGGGGGQAAHVDVVLDRERHAIQRQAGITEALGLGQQAGLVQQVDPQGPLAVLQLSGKSFHGRYRSDVLLPVGGAPLIDGPAKHDRIPRCIPVGMPISARRVPAWGARG